MSMFSSESHWLYHFMYICHFELQHCGMYSLQAMGFS